MFKIKLFLLSLTKKMWPKVTFLTVLAIITALIAVFLSDYIPKSAIYEIAPKTVSSVLNILASSMLAVTTFSLTTMLSAFNSASNNVTPRATRLLIEDSTTQNVLATFLGSFLFSLVGIIAINAGIYSNKGLFVLFIVTLGIIALIVITLIRWIEYLTKFGRLVDTTKLVDLAATTALQTRRDNPYLGGNPYPKNRPSNTYPLYCNNFGYIQNIDMWSLSNLTKQHDCHLFIEVLPGDYVAPNIVIAYVDCDISQEIEHHINNAFVIAEQRSFTQDPRFGLCVLSEIASRALSPAVNDPGTAIDVVGRLVRILSHYLPKEESEEKKVTYERIWVPELKVSNLFNDAFNPISRDGAAIYEVHLRLQKSFFDLYHLGNNEFKKSAIQHAAMALKRTDQTMVLEEEKQHLHQLSLLNYLNNHH